MTALTYRGKNRGGRGIIGGSSGETAAELTQRLYRLRYSDVTIRDDAGDIVGGITIDWTTGRRVWWAEA